MTEGPLTGGPMSYDQFVVSYERIVLDELQALVLSSHLTRAGLLNLRSRLSGSHEFKPTPQREWLCLRVEESLGMRRSVPDDLSALDELRSRGRRERPDFSEQRHR
jgi:hypothetical protein